MEMIKFNEEEKIGSINGALALRGEINRIVDELCEKGYDNLCWLGIRGTWASSMQAVVHMKEFSAIETFAENAAEYLTTGNRRIGKGTIVIISSVTGSTVEMVEAVKKAQADGAVVFGFIDVETAELAQMVDYEMAYKANEQLKFFMVADRFMHNKGEIDWYDRLYAEFDQHLANALVEVDKSADEFGKEFGADAIEISVHEFSAIDHADIQGHQFSFEEFNKFKDDKEFEDLKGNKFLPTDERGQDRRNISQYNCYHYLFNIVAGVSKPQYTDKQLQEINERNEKGFEFEGKHYTFYDGQQLLNRIALEIRKNKDTQIMAKSSGDDDLILSSQTKITQLTTKYRQVVKVSGLPNKLATKGWVTGYKRTSVKNLKK